MKNTFFFNQITITNRVVHQNITDYLSTWKKIGKRTISVRRNQRTGDVILENYLSYNMSATTSYIFIASS